MILQLSNVSKTYETAARRIRAVDHFSLELGAGEMVALRGASGSGKTTLLLIAGGLLRPDEGIVLVAGQNLYELPSGERARLRASAIGFVFQQFHLMPYLNVFDNVLASTIAADVNDAQARATHLLNGLGLGERLHHYPAQLSTGERQRTALARAMLPKPKLLLADEPTGNLDPDNGAAVLSSLSQFARNGGAVLLVTHDARAAEFADRVIDLTPAGAGAAS